MAGDGRVGAPQLVQLLGNWTTDGASGYTALADRIRLLILDGRLSPAVRVPAERDLATALPVSRGTVAAAYQRLRERGYLTSRRGAGSWTVLPDAPAGARPATPFAPHPDGTGLDLAHAAPSAPSDAVLAATRSAVEVLPRYLAGHGYDLLGLPALRERIAARYTARGLPTRPDQVMVTLGAQHAFMLVLRTLLSPGDRVLIEHPTYPNALDAVHRAFARPVPVPLQRTGWDIDLIAATLREATPRLAYLVPDFQNPTGLQMPVEQRMAVVELARRSGTALVVDETLAEIALDVPTAPPVASFVPAAHAEQVPVLTLGSASKSFWGGLRIGWLRASRSLLGRVAAARASVDLSSPVLDQLIATTLLARADTVLPGHLERLRANRRHLLAALNDHLPRWHADVPPGGLSLWIDLGAPVSSALVTAAARHGVHLAAGSRFGVGGAFESRLRLPYVLPPDTLDDAVARLSRAWHSLSPEPAPYTPATPAVI